ncbi:MAG TPA: DedA family protein [Longimicrobiaceae bacterium]|nr:DedA family protein [Longimicrobiaceae bacterium]
MAERAAALLQWLVAIPDWLLYVLVGLAAALENIVPPIPADVMVLIGGVIAGAGGANTPTLFIAVWAANVGGALLVYWFGRRYGPRFFQGRIGSYLLGPAQIQGLARAYARFGFPIIFFSRFLPVFRPVVPAFAGVARLGFWGTAIPIALASAIWYGALVYFGSVAGANWRSLLATVERFGGWLWAAAVVLILIGVYFWNRTRGVPSAGEEEV